MNALIELTHFFLLVGYIPVGYSLGANMMGQWLNWRHPKDGIHYKIGFPHPVCYDRETGETLDETIKRNRKDLDKIYAELKERMK